MQRHDPVARIAAVAGAVAAGALAIACGGGGGNQIGPPDGRIDAPVVDAPPIVVVDAGEEPPPPPTLGAQLDRAGRPGVRSLLLGTFATPDVQAAIRDTYDRAADPAAWRTLPLPNGVTVEREMAIQLALLDGFDRGRAVTGAGCGNTMKYAGPAGPTTYLFMARLFADDQIYVDTQTLTCGIYFDLELFRGAALPATTCGGRTPSHDVIDMTYSVLASGAFGIDVTGRVPRLTDGVAAHPEITTTFPFLGAPH